MKAILLTILLLPLAIHAQEISNSPENQIRTIAKETEKSKSGNYREVLNSFFQLVSNNLTNESKSLELNFTLYDLKSIFNKNLKTDYGYVKETTSRNLQFNLKGNFNGEFKEAGYTGGITYAIVNKRDKGLAEFTQEIETIYDDLQVSMDSITSRIIKTIPSEEMSYKMKALNEMAKEFINNQTINSKDYDPLLYNQFMGLINNYTTEFKVENDPKATAQKLDNAKTAYYKNLDQKPLWTIYMDGSVDNGDFSGSSIGTTYLRGGRWYEIDARAKFIHTDTLSSGLSRNELNLKAGVNFKVWKDSNERSLFEVKGYGEYNSIFKNVLPDEDRNKILANVDFRIRLSDDLWVPITVKYDIENSNLLGFLNITYNFETNTD